MYGQGRLAPKEVASTLLSLHISGYTDIDSNLLNRLRQLFAKTTNPALWDLLGSATLEEINTTLGTTISKTAHSAVLEAKKKGILTNEENLKEIPKHKAPKIVQPMISIEHVIQPNRWNYDEIFNSYKELNSAISRDQAIDDFKARYITIAHIPNETIEMPELPREALLKLLRDPPKNLNENQKVILNLFVTPGGHLRHEIKEYLNLDFKSEKYLTQPDKTPLTEDARNALLTGLQARHVLANGLYNNPLIMAELFVFYNCFTRPNAKQLQPRSEIKQNTLQIKNSMI